MISINEMYAITKKNNTPLLSDFNATFWLPYVSNYTRYDKLFNRKYKSFVYYMSSDMTAEEAAADFTDEVYNHLLVNEKKYAELYRINVINDDNYSLTDNYDMTEHMNKATSGQATSGERSDSISQTNDSNNAVTAFNSDTEHPTTAGSGTSTSAQTKGSQTDSNSGSEEYTLTRKGNIGVMTATDMISKHSSFWSIWDFYEYIFNEICIELLMVETDTEYTSTSGSGGSTGTTNYNDLTNKPSINSVLLVGSKSLDDLGIMPKTTLADVATTGSYNDLVDKPTIPEATEVTVTQATTAGDKIGTISVNGSDTDLYSGVKASDIEEKIESLAGGDEYISTQLYAVGDVCIYSNKVYRCILACSGQVPTNSTYWEQVSLASLSADKFNSITEVLTLSGDDFVAGTYVINLNDYKYALINTSRCGSQLIELDLIRKGLVNSISIGAYFSNELQNYLEGYNGALTLIRLYINNSYLKGWSSKSITIYGIK